MRTSTTQEARIFSVQQRATFVRVFVQDGDGVMRNINDLYGYDWLRGLTITDRLDAQTPELTLEVRRDFFHYSMAREHRTSRINLDAGGAYVPLLELNRRMFVETCVLPFGTRRVPPGLASVIGWRPLFDGVIDTVDDAGDIIQVSCRNRIAAHCMDRWIESQDATTNVYGAPGGSPVQTEMQSIITDWTDAALGVTLYTPTAPGWNIEEYSAESAPVMDELVKLAAQIGWVVGIYYHDASRSFRLTFFEPDRAQTTPDLALTSDLILDYETHGIDIDTIRNYAEVIYVDNTVTGNNPHEVIDDTSGARVATASNSTSIQRYGRRFISITEASSSNINTATEAQAMADALVADLANPTQLTNVRIPFDWRVELRDLVRLPADGRLQTSTADVAVVGYTHRLSPDECSTTLELRGQPAGYYHSHLSDRQARPGGAGAAVLGNSATPTLTYQTRPGAALVNIPYVSLKDFDSNEVFAGGTAGFTPSLSNLVARTRGRSLLITGAPGETEYIRGITLDRFGNRSPASTGTQVTYGYAGLQFLDPDMDVGLALDRGFDVQMRGASYPPDGWSMISGTWGTDATTGTTPVESGGTSLQLVNASAELANRYFPVQPGYPYRFLVRHQADANGSTDGFTFYAAFHSTKGSVVGSGTIFSGTVVATGSWLSAYAVLTAGSTARWGRVHIQQGTATTATLVVDRVEYARVWHMFRAYNPVASLFAANNTWEALRLDTELYDHGNWYDSSSNYRVDIPENGMYVFGGQVTIDSADGDLGVRILLNGTPVATQTVDCGAVDVDGGGTISASVQTGPMQLVAGDQITIQGRADDSVTTPTVQSGSGETYFYGQRLA